MNEELLYRIISAPHASEKGTRVADKYRQYVFRVLPQANKREIKEAVEKIFSVKVTTVRSLILKPRATRNALNGKKGKKGGYKKAYVTLAKGQQITFFSEGA